MHGHGEKLSRKREEAIAALLSEPSLEQAAAKAGVVVNTLRRWLALPEFQAAYRQARQDLLERAVNRLAGACVKAALVLEKNLLQGTPSEQTRAAVAVLTHTLKGLETLNRNGAPAADSLIDLLYHRPPAQANGTNGSGGTPR